MGRTIDWFCSLQQLLGQAPPGHHGLTSAGFWRRLQLSPPTALAASMFWLPAWITMPGRPQYLALPAQVVPLLNWQKLDGVFTSQLNMVSWGPNRLNYFGRGTDNACWHNWFSGAWSSYESFGGVFNSQSSSVSWAPNRIGIFGLGTDDGAWHKWWDGTKCATSWEKPGSGFTSPLVVTSWGVNEYVFPISISFCFVFYWVITDAKLLAGWVSLVSEQIMPCGQSTGREMVGRYGWVLEVHSRVFLLPCLGVLEELMLLGLEQMVPCTTRDIPGSSGKRTGKHRMCFYKCADCSVLGP
jgi:hypothetical protein